VALAVIGAGAPEPQPAVTIALGFPGVAPRLREPVPLRVSAWSTRAHPRVRLTLRLPPEVVAVTDGPLAWEGRLDSGAEVHLEARVVLTAPGRYRVGATAEVLEGPFAGQVAGAVLHLLVDGDGAGVRWGPEPPPDPPRVHPGPAR
jgi:hypothetical protein